MKNKILLIFVLVVSLFLSSCGEKEENNTSETQNIQETKKTSLNKSEKVLIAYVKNIKGDVINSKTNNSLKVGDILYVGDTIETSSDSEITMVMSDHSIFRLNSDSKFIFESIEGNDTNIKLEKGSLWGRVLKSVSSEEVINVSNNGVTAAIIGTSVLYEAGEQGKKPKVSVIDSYNVKSGEEGIKITDNDKEYRVLPEQFIDLSKISRAFNISNVYKRNDIINENSRRDLIYMTKIFEENKDLAEDITKKIYGEINKTIPTNSELDDFFKNSELVDHVANEIVDIGELLIKDEIISNLKVELENVGILEDVSNHLINDIVIKDYTSEGLDLEGIIGKYNDDILDLGKKLEKNYNVELDTLSVSKTELLQEAEQNLEEVQKVAEELIEFANTKAKELRLKGVKIEGEYDQKILDLENKIEQKVIEIENNTDNGISKIENQLEKDILEIEELYEKKISIKERLIDNLGDDEDEKEDELYNQIYKLEDKRDAEIELLEDKADKQIEKLENSSDSTIDNLDENTDLEIDKLENKRDEELDIIDEEADKIVDDAKEKGDVAIEKAEDYLDEVDDLEK